MNGVYLTGAGTTDNAVSQDHIGIDWWGISAEGSGQSRVALDDGGRVILRAFTSCNHSQAIVIRRLAETECALQFWHLS
ncbi:hypothetical protein ACFLWA_12270 [Chloroflexota bacterium]